MADFDLVIRGGRIFDGRGGASFLGDVAIKDGLIAEIAPSIAGKGVEEIDAAGLIVTPGFVDGHTHFDGQVVWDDTLDPSASHGVTTVVMGNCGVGFAPVKPQDHDRLIAMLEDVEDIPGTALHEGISWSWESFPEYLETLSKRQYSMDVAALLPHSPLRLYVMGDRAIAHEVATAEDLDAMSAIARKALEAGAIGISSSRVLEHRDLNGVTIPGTFADEDELMALAGAAQATGRGVFQVVPRGMAGGFLDKNSLNSLDGEVETLARLSQATGVQVIYSLAQPHDEPDMWARALDITRAANEAGAKLKAMVGPRAAGSMSGWAGFHIFMRRPTYMKIADLPLAEQLAELRKPEVKAAILGEADLPVTEQGMMSNFHLTLRRSLTRDALYDRGSGYEPDMAKVALGVIAEETGEDIESLAYDMMLREDGRAQLAGPKNNYACGSYEDVATMLEHPDTIVGLSDAGAHVRIICDASNTSFNLVFWARDRDRGRRIPLETVVRMQTADIADAFGFHDRGRLAPGLRADINVIDFDALTLDLPQVVRDLPMGGKRLLQGASGYVATLVAGTVTRRDDRDTGARPGRLVRDAGKHAPTAPAKSPEMAH